MSETASAPVQAGTGLSPRARITGLTVAVALTTVAISYWTSGFYEFTSGHLMPTVALAAAFAVSERLVFHVEARNEAMSYTPSDIALAIGILFVNPFELIIARLVGASLGGLVWRRAPLYKLAFNLAVFALETTVAILLFRSLAPEPTPSPLTWGVLLASLVVGLLTGAFLVGGAISAFEGGLVKRLLTEVTNAPVFYLPVAVMAASVAIPMLLEPWLGIVALSPAPVVWFVVRSHGALLHRYTDLTSVHEFSRQVGNDADPDDIAGTAVNQIAVNLRADIVALRVWDSKGTISDTTHGRASPAMLPMTADDPAWDEVFADRAPRRIVASSSAVRGSLAWKLSGARLPDALVAPLVDDRGRLGVIVVAGRHGVASSFNEDDRGRLAGMAQQLTVAVRKGQFNAQIQYQATHDRLTGLPNRGYFEAWIERALSEGRPAAVLLIDLDRFKEINDAFGHHAGDQLLIAVSERIRAVVGPEDISARFGGDEFGVLLGDAGGASAEAMADRLSVALERPFDLGPATVAIASSIGIAAAPLHGHDAGTLIRRADIAMYDAKNRHMRSSLYRDDLEENDSVRLSLLADLRSAINRGELEVHYQPKLDLRSGRVVSAEALARWNHPEQGPIRPDIFVNLAEQAGLIEGLTRQILGKSLTAVAEWQRRGWGMSVSVNVSAQSLLDEQLEDLVSDELRKTSVDPSLLTLEITESTMMGDPARSHRILRSLSDLGIRLSVDDYGTGFSSLVNLRHLPVSELKIDRSFVSELMSDSSDEVIVRSTIELGHNLGLEVVAEGVENQAIQDRLAEMGCDVAQGYGISRPLSSGDLAPWMQRHLDELAATAVTRRRDWSTPPTPVRPELR